MKSRFLERFEMKLLGEKFFFEYIVTYFGQRLDSEMIQEEGRMFRSKGSRLLDAIGLSDPRRKDEKGIAVSRYRTTRFSFLLPPLASILRTPYERGGEIHN